MPYDAVYVYCNMSSGGETCVFPDIHSSQMPNIPWRKEGDKTDWYSNLRGGFKITYETVGPVQMNFLRLLSQNGYQNFTYTCINSAAWFNAKSNSYDMAVKFMGENSIQFSSEQGSPKVDVLVDGCKTRKSKSETVFEIRTNKLDSLPLTDFYPIDYGLPHQAFGFEVGPVCFK
ncbi:collagen alpha-1(XI) chain-like [Myzus persicae]|uniref:collagen alpha-1(XI) chain-like n=1 Tax=Myzus persicae TaxID=13164 RepID=UPI000B9314FC|nr:collagen alpha-1(XI) chain-like [Myzus persicae]